MKTGYARCSTNESKQDIERQVRELKQAGAERVFLEYEHGDAVVKEQLSLLLEQAQPGQRAVAELARLLPGDGDAAGRRHADAADQVEQRRLAAAGGARDRRELAARDRQVEGA